MFKKIRYNASIEASSHLIMIIYTFCVWNPIKTGFFLSTNKKKENRMIKGRKLLWALSSMMLLSACTPTEAVTEEIRTSSSIESSIAVASVATDTKESKENEEFYS